MNRAIYDIILTTAMKWKGAHSSAKKLREEKESGLGIDIKLDLAGCPDSMNIYLLKKFKINESEAATITNTLKILDPQEIKTSWTDPEYESEEFVRLINEFIIPDKVELVMKLAKNDEELFPWSCMDIIEMIYSEEQIKAMLKEKLKDLIKNMLQTQALNECDQEIDTIIKERLG